MKRGSIALAFVGLMIGVMLFIAGIAFIEPLREQASTARTNMNCDWDNLSTGEQMTCIIIDVSLPGYIGIVLGIALSYLGLRRLKVIGSEE